MFDDEELFVFANYNFLLFIYTKLIYNFIHVAYPFQEVHGFTRLFSINEGFYEGMFFQLSYAHKKMHANTANSHSYGFQGTNYFYLLLADFRYCQYREEGKTLQET